MERNWEDFIERLCREGINMNCKIKELKIFIISGKARSGKDKTTMFLKDELTKKGKSVISLAYAKYIKDYAMNVSDWDGTDETKPRDLLQFIGTELIRKQIDEDFFINRMIEDIKVYSYFCDTIIISDARFSKEIEVIKKTFKDVTSINVVRPLFVSDLTEEQKEHSTETGLLDFKGYDIEIVNDGNLEDLKMKVVELMKFM